MRLTLILSCAAVLALVLLGASPSGASRTRENVSPGCRTHACAKRVCRASSCRARVRVGYWQRERAKLSAAQVAMLQRLGGCETRGIALAAAYRWKGHHRGRYQYDFATWAQAGGSGDPADASPAEQDVRTARFYPSHRGQWACSA